MANLGNFTIKTDGEYQNLAEISGLTFTSGDVYVLQVKNECILCESVNKPDSGGFVIDNKMIIQWKKGDGDLWVKTDNGFTVINIAE